MNTPNDLNTVTKNQLASVFNAFKSKSTDDKINEIVARQYVHYILHHDYPVLICGLNPSYRKTEDHKSYSFDFNDEKIKVDRYFSKFHKFVKGTPTNYIDLFTQKHTSQADLYVFLENEQGVEFLNNQLLIAQNTIEAVKPKLILLFNKKAGEFWGRDAKANDDGTYYKAWMGYTFEPTSIEGAFKITGLLESENRINSELKESLLVGSVIYFSTYISYTNNKEAMAKIEKDIPELIKKYCG